jgi:hypothetical protein
VRLRDRRHVGPRRKRFSDDTILLLLEVVIGNVVVRAGSDVAPERLAAIIRAVRQA